MEEREKISIYQQAIENFGVPNQVFMVMEETGEMLNALAKLNRERSTEDEVITELADVSIMMEQMAVVFGYDKFKAEKERKIQRLKQRLENFIAKRNEESLHK